MRFFVIGIFLLILFSLGSALYYLVHDKGGTDRTVKALTLRISLSLTLFLILMASYYFGLIPPEGLRGH
ncbi:MAG TPA: twin transmembrane helix small protein [Thiobacillaceae bacterium]|nr:twin transmembrane helix small protein [Thiobacillaceae bacterium]